MSAGVEQKPKAQRSQVQNGPVNTKDNVTDEDFDRYMQTNQASQQGYTSNPNMAAPAPDSYMASYYPYSFQYTMPGSETTWSTAGDNFNFNNYQGYDSTYAGAADYYNQPGTTPPYLNQSFNFFPGNADFVTGSWGNSSAPQAQGQQSASRSQAQGTSYYDYARAGYPQTAAAGQRGGYGQGINGLEHDGKAHGMKAVEQGMSGLSIGTAGDKQTVGAGALVRDSSGRPDQDSVKPVSQAPTTSIAQPAANAPPAASTGSSAPKPQSWAAIASKPAKPQPKVKAKTGSHAPVPTQLPPMKQTMTIGTWNGDNKNTKNQSGGQQGQPQVSPGGQEQQQQGGSMQGQRGGNQGQGGQGGGQQQGQGQQQRPQAHVQPQRWGNTSNQHGRGDAGNQASYASRTNASNSSTAGLTPITAPAGQASTTPPGPPNPVLEKLRSANEYNPSSFALDIKNSRMFIIKSYSEDDIHRSIKYGIWCSTEHGNKRLDQAFRERKGKGPIYLLYSVNGSGHFCGVAQMISGVDYNVNTGVWAQDKWKGRFDVKWVYVKDVPNSQLRHIRLENNDNKPVTNSRDTQEVPLEKAKQVVKIIHQYRHTTSIFDDFGHYEKRQEEENTVTRKPTNNRGGGRGGGHSGGGPPRN